MFQDGFKFTFREISRNLPRINFDGIRNSLNGISDLWQWFPLEIPPLRGLPRSLDPAWAPSTEYGPPFPRAHSERARIDSWPQVRDR